MPGQAEPVNATEVARIDRLSLAIDHEASALSQRHSGAPDRCQQRVPVVFRRDAVSNFRGAQGFTVGANQLGENGFIKGKRGGGRTRITI